MRDGGDEQKVIQRGGFELMVDGGRAGKTTVESASAPCTPPTRLAAESGSTSCRIEPPSATSVASLHTGIAHICAKQVASN